MISKSRKVIIFKIRYLVSENRIAPTAKYKVEIAPIEQHNRYAQA